MAPSGSHKRKTAAGVGLATSVLLSPHNPKQTTVMGFGKFFTLPSSSSSSNNSSRPQWSAHNYPPRDDDAPPAYSPKKGSDHNDWATDSKMPAPQTPYVDPAYFPTPTISQGEDPLRQLKYYDIVIILDDSYSMMETDPNAIKCRWDQAWDALETLVVVGAQYDTNGIDIHLLNNRKATKTVKNKSDLAKLRKSVGEPEEGNPTPTGDVLETLLLEYRKQVSSSTGRLTTKKRYFIVITDGAASDSPEEGIIEAATFLQNQSFPHDQIGIQLLQVGNDKKATKFLEELDRDIKLQQGGGGRDIVDTVMSNGQDLDGPLLIKTLTGGINRLQDKSGEKLR